MIEYIYNANLLYTVYYTLFLHRVNKLGKIRKEMLTMDFYLTTKWNNCTSSISWEQLNQKLAIRIYLEVMKGAGCAYLFINCLKTIGKLNLYNLSLNSSLQTPKESHPVHSQVKCSYIYFFNLLHVWRWDILAVLSGQLISALIFYKCCTLHLNCAWIQHSDLRSQIHKLKILIS